MAGARILLVEDDEVIRDLIVRNLQIRGHEVVTAGDAQTALAQMRITRFDLVLLDINLPDKTGWDVLRVAQQEKLLASLPADTTTVSTTLLPVVILSAVRVSASRLAEFRPLAYLSKPFPMDALLRLAAEAAGRRATQQARPLA